MTPVELSRTVLRAVRRAVDDGELRLAPPGLPERVVVTPPGAGGWGDYATNVALQLARPAGQPPLRVAEILRPHLLGSDGVDGVVVTGPGFLNIQLRDTAATDLVEEILRRGPRYGFRDGGGDVRRLTCPGDVRAVVVMDVVGRLMRAQGDDVRTRCRAPQDGGGWAEMFGVRVDSYGEPGDADGSLDVRPVPALGDPLPLGRDAGRWALLHPAGHDRPQLDAGHLVQRESNPLFRVRYAHARCRGLRRNAVDLGFSARAGETGDVALTAVLADHPRVLERAAATRAPDRLTRHLVAVADATLPFLATVLPRGGEKPSAAHRARLALAEAAGTVLAGGLSLLGIDAPEHL
ncbi:ArgS-related anticodon-binding protein NrtL [Streptomyces sp. NPDC087294]|uniref:ArgS-related anticodon-binding protein NrtL n=1 Tax=Streptomyces sp. NPDC087294 TaxID=3365777 RepID=UPI003815E8EA